MAEHKACADLVAVTGDSGDNASHREGECLLSSPSSGIDDSGTESGEDFRLLSPEILAEVQNALTRLEAALPSLDPTRREALVRLVNRLQSCLKLQPPNSQPPAPSLPTPPDPPPPAPQTQPQPPVKRYANRRHKQQRHTVGVSKEELADARRWLLETAQQTQEPLKPPPADSHSSTNVDGLQEQKAISQGFRPVKFNPNQTKVSDNDLTTTNIDPLETNIEVGEEPVILTTALTHSTFSCEVPKTDSGSSLLEYDPSLVLFTPAQSVQIAVHKAAINKQLSEEESKRENSRLEEIYNNDDGDLSSVEEDQSIVSGQVLEDAISSAQRLLQIAADKKNPTPSRFHDRNSKKQKMKRANTIDIPKPNNFQEIESLSSDEYGSSKDDLNKYSSRKVFIDKKLTQPEFIPKTESDLKFLAFLQQANKNEGAVTTYNPSARGGQHWTNRFSNLKTAFESTNETNQGLQAKSTPPSITQIWENSVNKAADSPTLRHAVQNRTPQPLQNKNPWTMKQEEEGVVIGSLTVKTAPVNKFSHASKSAFKPIEKKPVSLPQKQIIQPQKLKIQPQNPSLKSQLKPFENNNQNFHNSKCPENKITHQLINSQNLSSVSGTVKQLAAQQFSGENVPSKPIIKQYPVIQDRDFNATGITKQKAAIEQKSKPKVNIPTKPLPPLKQFNTSITSAHRQFNNQQDPETATNIKIPQKPLKKDYKDGSEYSPPKQYINSPPLSTNYSDPFDYTTEQRSKNSSVTNKQINNYEQHVLPADKNEVTYYSQQPAFVQHSTYAQPLDSFSPFNENSAQTSYDFQSPNKKYYSPPEQPQECPASYAQQYNGPYVQTETDHVHSLLNKTIDNGISSHCLQKENGHISTGYNKNVLEEKPQHRFTEESLVPNPLVLSQVCKLSPTASDYLPDRPHFANATYEPSSQIINYEHSLAGSNKSTVPLITSNLYENNSSQGSLTSSKLSDSSSSIKQYLNVPYEYGQDISPVISNISKSPYCDESVVSSGAPSPQWNPNDLEDNEISISEGTEIQTAVARVMGQSQCQKAVTVSNRTQHRFDENRSESDSLLRTLLKSPNSPTNMAKKQSTDKLSTYSESQPSKSPLLDKSLNSKLHPDVYYNSVAAKPPMAVTHHNDRLPSPQNKPVSSAASAFRPLVNNLSKPPESGFHTHPPIPTPPIYSKKSDTDNRLFNQQSTKSFPSGVLPNSHKPYESELSQKVYSSQCRSPSSSSPSFPNVLQKSESWHQLVKEQMGHGRHPPPKSPRLSKTKSSHALAFPKQYEAHLTPDLLAVKQSTVDQYLKPNSKEQLVKTTKQTLKQKKTVTKLDENLDNVDEAFETLFQEVAKRK